MRKDFFSKDISEFFTAQLSEWELAGNNYLQLEKVRTRHLVFPGFEVLVQFNPERLRSTAAETDSGSIKVRPCFLCEKNRPEQQRGISFDDGFIALVNPYPIFKRHLTIASCNHIDQRIRNNFGRMLSIAGALPDYVVFYNGPQCGASAPDHLHFQAGNRGFLPLERDFESGRFTNPEITGPGSEIFTWKGYRRGIITLKGCATKPLENLFDSLYERLSVVQTDKPEPMLNILAYKTGDSWIIHIIPRKLHRPAQYYAEGKDKIIISPASVDLGGVVITPREDDYDRISEEDISDIFRQVCFGEEELNNMINEIK